MTALIDRLVPIPDLDGNDLLRFWNYVEVDKTGCMVWTAGRFKNGYGRFTIKGESFIASRVAYKIETGLDPGQFLVCHECNNPPCVNPKHLFLGTSGDNNRQAFQQGRNSQRGELNPGSKLTVELVKEIRILHNSGLGYIKIAKELNNLVSSSAIAQIIQGKIWGHVK